jgi:hypothetical protein
MLLERIKYILTLLFFLFLLGSSIKLVNDGNRRLGWVGVALWGVMFVYTAYHFIRECFTDEPKARLREKTQTARAKDAKSKFERLKPYLVKCWTIFSAILIGTAANLFTGRIEGWVKQSLAVWLSSFLFTLIFYSFQKRQKHGISSFPVWVVFCAVMGVVSILFFYLEDWL